MIVAASDGIATDTQALTVTVGDVDGVTITGTKGKDKVNATKTVKGEPLPTGEEDQIVGKGRKDKLSGLDGNDTIGGGGGRDVLKGGAGDDRLAGGGGRDKYIGGDGIDSFRLRHEGDAEEPLRSPQHGRPQSAGRQDRGL